MAVGADTAWGDRLPEQPDQRRRWARARRSEWFSSGLRVGAEQVRVDSTRPDAGSHRRLAPDVGFLHGARHCLDELLPLEKGRDNAPQRKATHCQIGDSHAGGKGAQ